MAKLTRRERIRKKHLRVRKKVFGTSERPRLSVYKSLKHIYAQIIDDTKGVTLVSASTLDKELRDKLAELTKTEEAREVGRLIAKRALEKGIKKVVFDRGGFIYHGRIKALAEGAREGGLEF
ncbi:LSU ribosomal protein L18P [Balnearium lithotrophicum]|jgi:large subunit ribosomal protein L18|uniref:Large ribosomal subunit protein uL18 n=1 Tax=Balnearium lithotrophicum TaxID=223788 RepID=A0A521CUM1_9BACT|nr:50S ribosomal protein L18 [Balnearium lithotrophicum]SMO63154.1 LSU ribosomal protein L18P [Balnearium lithotrophicum]